MTTVPTDEPAPQAGQGEVLTTSQWVANRLNRVMEVRGYGQREWARAAGISQGALSTILTQKKRRGKPTEATVDTLLRLCTSAQVPLWCLLHDSDEVLDIALGMTSAEPRSPA